MKEQKIDLSYIVDERLYCLFWIKEEVIDIKGEVFEIKVFYEFRKNNCLYKKVEDHFVEMSIPFYEENRLQKVHIVENIESLECKNFA